MKKQGEVRRRRSRQYQLHDCYNHYELIKRQGRRVKLPLFKCDGCKMEGYGERYRCKLCLKELHIACRHPTRIISHEFSPGSLYQFHQHPFTKICNNEKEYAKRCDACTKDICGFSYHSRQDNLDLHPCCSNLQTTIFVDDTVFYLRASVYNRCLWCKKRKICGDIPGWSYVSNCKRYNFHVYCMTEMGHEACSINREGEGELNLKLAKIVNGNGGNVMFITTIKCVVKIILSFLLGDPTSLIPHDFIFNLLSY